MPQSFGNSFPKFTLVTTSYNLVSCWLRSFTRCSMPPNPCVSILPVTETSAKSAKFASALTTAAQPPLLSNSDTRISLNQISAL